MSFKVGDRVRWTWGEGTPTGVIKEIHLSRVEKTIKGASVVRNASRETPSFTIEQDDGDVVFKSTTELRFA